MSRAKYFFPCGIIAICLVSSFIFAQDKQSTQHDSPDDHALRAVVDEFFAAYSRKDMDAFVRPWSAKSPDLAVRRQEMQKLFGEAKTLAVTSLLVTKVTVINDKAKLRVSVELDVIDAQGAQATSRHMKMNRVFEVVREAGVWKIWREISAEEELAVSIAGAKTKEERRALIESEKDLLTVELVRALNAQGGRLYNRGNYSQSLDLFQFTTEIAQQLDDKVGSAVALQGMGLAHGSQGNHATALEYLQRALKIADEARDNTVAARVLNNIGNALQSQGNFTQALEYHQRSLTLFNEQQDEERGAIVLNNIGNAHRQLGNYAYALEYYRKSLEIKEKKNNQAAIALTVGNIGFVHFSQGNYTEALKYYQRSLRIRKELSDPAGRALMLDSIGNVYDRQGNYTQALEHYQQSFQISQENGDEGGTARALINIGNIHFSQGDYRQALEHYEKSLRIAERKENGAAIAIALNNIGNVHRARGSYTQAVEALQKSLAIKEGMRNKAGTAVTLLNIGSLYVLQRDYVTALDHGSRAAAIAREIGSLETLWEAQSVMGEAYQALHQPDRAREAFDEAITTIESLRALVAGPELERERFFENKLAPYHSMVRLRLARGNAVEALAYAERAKARVLLDVLSSGRVNITKGMTALEQDDERKLRAELVSLNTQISAEGHPARLAELNSLLRKRRLDYEAFQTTLYAAHPDLRSRRGQSPPLKPEEASNLLPAKGAVLEYVVTEDTTYLFVLTRSNKPEAMDLKALTVTIGSSLLAKRVEHFREQLATRDVGFRKSALELYELLLRPAWALLQDKTSLVIVPDGTLWEMPFQALQPAPNRYLLEDYAISYAPSLSVLREMTKLRRKSFSESTDSRSLLAFGNPALLNDTAKEINLPRGNEKTTALPESEKEVKTLAQLYGASRSVAYVGAEAREERLKSEAGRYDVLHLATHGILDSSNPMYSHVILSQVHGDSNEDGLLEAWEVMNLELKAEFVVLSACETARGRVGAGEGVIGLTWAWFVAGCPASVVSLWKVDSASTTQLMLDFHRNFKSATQNRVSRISKAEALRQAEMKLLRSKQYSHPFYWAGFVVIGDGF
jgi:CHAT domain-containing protein/Tfp pilus assembly protein PilF